MPNMRATAASGLKEYVRIEPDIETQAQSTNNLQLTESTPAASMASTSIIPFTSGQSWLYPVRAFCEVAVIFTAIRSIIS